MGRRRQAREIALQALYVADSAKMDPAEAFAIVNRRAQPDDEGTLDFARELFDGAIKLQAKIDERIQATAQNWAMPRMACVDRNVLRLASYELLYRDDTPVNVIIDEAIEIARKFSTEDSTKFINGILDKIKEHRKKDGASPEDGSR